jgi:hypothetical protein
MQGNAAIRYYRIIHWLALPEGRRERKFTFFAVKSKTGPVHGKRCNFPLHPGPELLRPPDNLDRLQDMSKNICKIIFLI